MSDKMCPISFEKMLIWITRQLKENESIFGIDQNKFYYNKTGKSTILFNEKLSSPLGPAAGPNSQLAQNIVCAYLTGSRYFELKTVQIIDGEDITVTKPCINVRDEGYNVEWSTELKVSEAFDEYVKAWFLLHVLMKELEITLERDFLFNMSVGYDLKGIKSPKMDEFIEGLSNASSTGIWKQCKEILFSHMDIFSKFRKEDLEKISPIICKSITISTLHGCPVNEIDEIGEYLLSEKKLNTYIKLNPMLLGEKFVRETLDDMGYDYVSLNKDRFVNDLLYLDCIDMLTRLKGIAKKLNLEIGVKLTNTLPVKILSNEFQGEEMYLSGRALFPLAITLASKLAREFDGNLQISFCGGVDLFNVDKILSTGINPITFATCILKPGGYEKITQMGKKIEKQLGGKFTKINIEVLEDLSKQSLNEMHYFKGKSIKDNKKLNPSCNSGCELCVGLCPNRANVAIKSCGDLVSTHQVIHLDSLCNECGNCAIFCPHKRTPYKDKITAFWSMEGFINSSNEGFFVENLKKGICLVRTQKKDIITYIDGQKAEISNDMACIIRSFINNYSYML